MGGKALNIETERKTTEQYNKIASIIIPILEKELKTDVTITKCHRAKETHGDMDILVRVNSKVESLDMVEFITKTFNPRDIYHSVAAKTTDKYDKKDLVTLSFDYDNFQIDLIFIKEENWEFAYEWFSNDPFSNTTGKIAHLFGLKFSWEGLKLPFRKYSGELSKNIIITKNHRKAVEFLGYNYDKYEQGFDNVQEIYDYVISSKYFDSECFKMENLNHIDRKRNVKRTTYQEFLKYIDDNKIYRKYIFKGDNIKFIDKYFPEANLIEKLNKYEEEYLNEKLIYEKFNGILVMAEFPEFKKGKELGDVINKFKESFEDFTKYAITNSSKQIMNDFTNFINEL